MKKEVLLLATAKGLFDLINTEFYSSIRDKEELRDITLLWPSQIKVLNDTLSQARFRDREVFLMRRPVEKADFEATKGLSCMCVIHTKKKPLYIRDAKATGWLRGLLTYIIRDIPLKNQDVLYEYIVESIKKPSVKKKRLRARESS